MNSDLFVNFLLLAFIVFILHSPVFKRKKKSIRRSETDISEWNRECKISVWPWHCSCWNINGIKCRWIGNVCAGQRFLQAVFLELSRCLSRCCCGRGASPAQPNEEWQGWWGPHFPQQPFLGRESRPADQIEQAARAVQPLLENTEASWGNNMHSSTAPAALPRLTTEAWEHRWLCWGESGPVLGSPRCQASPAVFLHSFCPCML